MKQHYKIMLTALALSIPIALAGSIIPEVGAAPPKTSHKAPKAPANETDAQRAERLRKGREAFFKEAEKAVQPTPAQKKKIDAVIDDVSQKIRKTESDKKLSSAQKRERVGNYHRELYSRVLPILDAKQQAKLRELMANKHEIVDRATNQR